MNATTINKAVLTGVLSVLVAGFAGAAQAEKPADTSKEKCYGVAKAGKNDCGGGSNACAGHSKADGAKDSFLVVPAGLCEKLVGGSLTAAAAEEGAKTK